MEPNNTFTPVFLDACFAGELSQSREALATGRLTTEDLDEGLRLAAYMAHPNIVADLFDAGARVSLWTIRTLPGRDLQQHPSVVRHFLDQGLDPNIRRSNGEPLLPIHEEDTSLVELYLAYGANLQSDLLFFAAAPRVAQGEVMTRFLLDKGLDPNVMPAEWGSPLHRAVYAAKPNIVQLLLDAGADARAISTDRKNYGEGTAQVAERIQHPGTREAILSLLEGQVDRGNS